MTHTQSKIFLKENSLVDMALGRLTPEQSLAVIRELETNPKRSEEFELILDVLSTASSIPTIEESREINAYCSRNRVREDPATFTVIFRSAAAIFLILGSFLFSGEYYHESAADLLRVRAHDLDVRTRGEANAVCDIAYSLIERGNDKEAGELVDWCLNAYAMGEERAHAHLLKGGLLLMKSERRSLLGFTDLDTVLARQGLEELDLATKLTSQRRIEECALWLRLKGHLMLGDKQSARIHANKIVRIGGVRQNEAKEILKVVDW